MEDVNIDLATESTVINEDEEFYENLEAPKFVDFTALDLSPEDRSWFCHKIGCDLNHEQIDPEALNKSFMLRVLAARSPNVRLHKSLKRSNGRLNANCPHSAPAKQPRSRLVRLSTATEVPEKLANSKLRNHLISSLKSPQSRAKKMILTTIGEKEATSTPKNQGMNSKNQPASGAKNESGFFSAKPIFSPTPQKEIKEICAKLRKLNLNNTKRRIVPSRYLGQVSKAAKRSDESKLNDPILRQETEVAPRKNISRPLRKTKKQLLEENVQNLGSDVTDREQKSKLDPQKERPGRKLRQSIWKESVEHASTSGVENKGIGEVLVLKPEIRENVGANNTNMKQKLETGPKRKSSRQLWKSNQPVLKSNIEYGTRSGTENEEVVKREGSKPKSKDNLGTGIEKEGLKTKLGNCDEMRPKRKGSRALWKSNQPVLKPNIENGTTSGTENEEVVKRERSKSKLKDNLGTGIEKEGLKTKLGNCDEMGPKRKRSRAPWKSNQPVLKPNIENGTPSGTENEEVVKKEGLKSKIKDNFATGAKKEGLKTELGNCDEDKENIMQNDTQRVELRKKTKAEGKKSSLLRTIENVPPQQVLKIQKKPSQVNPDQGSKNKKTTNPKPFRFRTDERGILKEANLEKKKLVQTEPVKEESKSVLRKDTGTVRCKGRVIPSKIQCLNKATSFNFDRLTTVWHPKGGRMLLQFFEKKKPEAIENTNSTRGGGMKKIACPGNTKR
ncbi:hypothetical protein FCM35_KLT11401 [Carex littledalei]|uniref:Uncharacterized protein n=1 Tax=Carex littledalei TaxID=544730 RepID=A0A833QK19_9POAL|nr:hypothetical protein FCM35_KLT11401 [Carex littledalei]